MVDPSSPSHQLVGAVLNGRFRLVRLLGEGGMGAVFEADSLRGEGKCAIKLLHAEFTTEPSVVDRFFAEAQTAQSLQHPNIARVFEATRAEDGTPYIVMELLHGVPLIGYISAVEPMRVEHAVPIVNEILQALSLAHARGVVHRDLKPDNIFLVRDARGGTTAKVLDFGIAKVMDVAGGMGSKTRTGALLGTPGYMSPEQVRSSKSVDPRSDLWSVGSMFYEMLTGTDAFPADNDFARLTKVLTDEVRPIGEVVPQLASWAPFFRRALAKSPADRFQTAEEMSQALLAAARGGPAVPGWGPAPGTTSGAPVSLAPVGIAHPSVAGAAPAAHPVSMAPLPGYPGSSIPISMAHSSPPGPPAPLAPLAGAPGSQSTTHVSGGQNPHGSPQGSPALPGHAAPPPPVEVISAGSYQQGAPWWLVGVIAFVCMSLGFAAGFLAGGG